MCHYKKSDIKDNQNISLIKKQYSLNVETFFSTITSCFLVAFFAVGVVWGTNTKYIKNSIINGWNYEFFMPIIIFYIFVLFLLTYKFKKIYEYNNICLSIFLFFISFIPRLLSCLIFPYYSSDDFSKYYNMGYYFLKNSYSSVAHIVDGYQLPTFGGLAVLNGALMKIFGSSAFGQRLGHSILASLIAIVLFHLGAIWSKKIGLIAALIFCIYPSNIIFSLVNTNQHGGILFFLLAFYFLISARKETHKVAVVKSIIAAFFINIANFFHPSKAPHLVAIIIYFILAFLSDSIKIKKWDLKIIYIISSFLLFEFFFNALSIYALLHLNLINSTNQLPMISKIVVGFNVDTIARYSYDDYAMFKGLSSNEAFPIAYEIIKQRILSVNIFEFLFNKINIMWFWTDTSFFWLSEGIEVGIQKMDNGSYMQNIALESFEKLKFFLDDFQLFDSVYCTVAYILASIGLLVNLKNKSFHKMDMLKWCLLGWVILHFISEIQQRYRYFAMPIIFFFAAIGIEKLVDWIKLIKKKASMSIVKIREVVNK